MRRIVALFVFFSGAVLLAGGLTEPVELITYNIRLNTPGDGDHAWPQRKDDVVALFRFHRADIFCVQEALPGQMDDLAAAFPGFSYEGAGRTDGKREGEFSAVFYNHDRFEKLDGGTFWLSETPGVPGLGWDAAYPRICSWVRLKDRDSGTPFYIFTTHFDHVGVVARKNSAALIVQKIREINVGKDPVVLCGDFNLPPGSEPIGLIRKAFRDAFDVSELPPYGSVATFHGFTYDDPPGDRIDYVFVSDSVTVLRYGALTDSRGRSFFSDHLPVLVTLDFPQKALVNTFPPPVENIQPGGGTAVHRGVPKPDCHAFYRSGVPTNSFYPAVLLRYAKR